MRIGIDARFLGPGSKGLGRYTQKLLLHIQEIHDEHTYVIFLRKENESLFVSDDPRFTKVIADYKWYSLAELTLFVWTLLRAKCDLVHFPHFNVPLMYYKPFIVTVHDLILLRFPTHKNSTRSRALYWLKYQIYKLVIARAISGAASIIAVSDFTRNDILEHYAVAPEKVIRIYEAGSDISKNTQGKSLATEAVRSIIESQQKYFLYVGNAYPHKNLDGLVEAFAQYKIEHKESQAQLVLVGRKDFFYKRLEQHMRRISDTYAITLSECVVILDTIDNVSLELLYQKAHAFVFASLYEGFGLPPLEACSYGVPVLSSQVSSMPEVLGDAALYADPTHAKEFARAMSVIDTDQELRVRLRERGPLQAQKFSWQRMAQETHSLYRKYASSKKR